jgi:hypothetical protein
METKKKKKTMDAKASLKKKKLPLINFNLVFLLVI